MILRRSGTHFVAISQPAHAWLAGRLAENWGNDAFAIPPPHDAVLCAAALHDIGWLDWERSPRLDAATGYPFRFEDVPAEEHTRLWAAGVEQAAAYGDLVALFISRHGDAIYEKTFDPASARPTAIDAVEAFTTCQSRYQNAIVERIRQSRPDASSVSDENLQRVEDFIVAVDTISLHLCWGIREPVTISEVPTGGTASATLQIRQIEDQAITIDPWPFATKRLFLSVEGIALDEPSKDQNALDGRLAAAPRVCLDFDLRQA